MEFELTVVLVRDTATVGDDDAAIAWFWNRVLSAVNESRSCSGFCSLSSLSYEIKIHQTQTVNKIN